MEFLDRSFKYELTVEFTPKNSVELLEKENLEALKDRFVKELKNTVVERGNVRMTVRLEEK